MFGGHTSCTKSRHTPRLPVFKQSKERSHSPCVCAPATDDINIICDCLEAHKHWALLVQNLVIFHSLRPTFLMGFKLMWGPKTWCKNVPDHCNHCQPFTVQTEPPITTKAADIIYPCPSKMRRDVPEPHVACCAGITSSYSQRKGNCKT